MKYVAVNTSRGAMRGMLHLGNKTQPAILIHGYFGANRIGHARLYVKIANALAAQKNCDVLRVDAIGAGESDGEYEDITLSTFVNDFTEAANWLIREESWTNDLIVIGHSMGANVALLLIKNLKCKGAILISPEIQIDGCVDNLFTYEQLKELKNKGKTIRKGIPISSKFVDEIRSIDVNKVINGLTTPCAVIQGTEDEIFNCKGGQYLSNLVNVGKFIGVDQADHNFIGRQNELKLIEAIFQSLEWINIK